MQKGTLQNMCLPCLKQALLASGAVAAAVVGNGAILAYCFGDNVLDGPVIQDSLDMSTGEHGCNLGQLTVNRSGKLQKWVSAIIAIPSTGDIESKLVISHPDWTDCAFSPQQQAMLQQVVAQLEVLLPLQPTSDYNSIIAEVQALRERSEFFETIVNNLPTDIAVFDSDHKYLYVSPKAISVKEYRDFLIGKDDYDYCRYRNRDISLADERRRQFLQVKQTLQQIEWEDSVMDAQGQKFTSLRRFFPILDDNGTLKMAVGFGLDITDRKQLEENLSLLVQELSSQNSQLTDFCQIISHNLRGPVANLRLLAEYIMESDDPEEREDLIQKLLPLSEKINENLDALVESLKVKADAEVEIDCISLLECLEGVISIYEIELQRLGAQINIDFSAQNFIMFPSRYLTSIFDNLLSNALKYKSPERTLAIEVKSVVEGGRLRILFSDNGQGMDMKRHGKNLFKIGKVFHTHPGAKGFGLFMSKTQVEAMNGKIWADSEVNVGTTFYMEVEDKAPRVA
ncbi:MAG: PAS domain-containing sensor histidine kinase [Chitinophagia bacterium]|nr:PAS domain-containing sensor histidine kinase [Chitinophagia bacterium]